MTAPLRRNADANGVDLVQGTFELNFEEASIGAGPAELDLVRHTTTYFFSQWDQIFFRQTSSGGVVTSYIGMPDGSADVFQGTTNVKANGATLQVLNGTATYTAADGTKMVFVNPEPDVESSSFCGNLSGYPCDLLPDSITYPDGRKIQFSFDVVGCDPLVCTGKRTFVWKLTGVSNSFGYSIAFTYKKPLSLYPPPSDWYVRTKTQLERDSVAQATVTYGYPTGGGTDVTDPTGNVWHLTDTSVTRPGEATPFLQSDSLTAVTSVTNNGVTTHYNRVVSGNTATMTLTDPLSHQTVVTSNLSISQPTSITDPLNRTTNYQYDTNGRLTQITRPEGNRTQFTYDSRGNVLTTTQVATLGLPPPTITTSASFDSTCTNIVECNKPNSTTDGNGNVTNYAYDATHGGVTSVTQPAPVSGAVRPQTRYSYTQITTASGDPVYMPTTASACQALASCSGAADETKTTATYDSHGNTTSVSRANGTGALVSTNAMTYDGMGDVLTVDGPLSGTADTTRYLYDAERRAVGAISPDPDGAGILKNRAIRMTYRADGQVSKEELGTTAGQTDADWAAFAPLQAVDVTFDGNARPVTSKLSASGTNYALTQTSYDSLGRTDCTAVRMNTATYGSLPASACTLGTQGSYGPDRITQTIYDAASEVTQNKVAVGTSDAATERTLSYSDNGMLATLKDAENNLTTFEYDGFDRLLKTRYPNSTKGSGTSSTTDYEQLTYDNNSNVVSRRVRSGDTIGYTRDNLGRVTHKGASTLADIFYSYDNLGRMLTATFATGGQGVTNSYDALSRLTSTSSNVGGTAHAMSYLYDLAGNRTRETWWDGFYIDYDRLVTGELAKLRANGAVSGAGVLATYQYDNLGNRLSLVRGNGASTSYTYDPVSRLASFTHDLSGTAYDVTRTFSYNPASQIVGTVTSNDEYATNVPDRGTTGFTANGLNQNAAIDGATTSHDANGNLTVDPWLGRTFSYDDENRMTSGTWGSASASLTHDPLGRLDAYSPNSGAYRRFIYDGDEVSAELDSSGTVTARYVRGDGPDEVLLQYVGSDASDYRYHHLDERGSDIAWSDPAGAAASIAHYDEYGIPAATNAGRFQFTGQMWLSEIGVQYSKNRMYSPQLGRFLQTDPIGYAGDGPNLYAYVLNDPINLVDPLGLLGNDIVVTACRLDEQKVKDKRAPAGFRCELIQEVLYPPGFGATGIASFGGQSQIHQTNPQCKAATGVQGWIERGAGLVSEVADDGATIAAVTGQEEFALPLELVSWAATSARGISQASRGDTHGATATFAAAAAGTLVGKLNKIIPIGKGANELKGTQDGFNSAVSSVLGNGTGKALGKILSCE